MSDHAEAARLVHLAELNLRSGDLESCLQCCEQVLDVPLDEETLRGLRRVLANLEVSEDSSLARQLTLLQARSAVLQAEAPAIPVTRAPATPPAPMGTDTAAALQAARSLISPEMIRLIRDAPSPPSADQTDHEPALPVTDVLGRLMAADLDLDRTLELALDLTLLASGAERGFILVKDADGKLAVERGRGLERQELPDDLSRSILNEVLRTHDPVICQDACDDRRFSARESILATGLRSIAALPILGADPDGLETLVGIIYLDDRTRAGRFDASTGEVLASLARAVAGPIQNARRFQAERNALTEARQRLRQAGIDVRPQTRRLVARSQAMQEVMALATRVAGETVPILIQGESGSGKELLARLIHDASPRAREPFVAGSCGALAENLLEAELFGVTKGAFTGADRDREGLFRAAHGGTLLLNEVGEMSPNCQKKLLRVLQEHEVRPVGGSQVLAVDVRLITASHRDLADMVRQGTFREDLFYRLNVVRLHLPPLRERREDISLLVEHFMDEISSDQGQRLELSQPTLARLAGHDWPGNVRELRNAVWRLAIAGDDGAPWLAESPGVAADDHHGSDDEDPRLRIRLRLDGAPPPLKEAREAFDREYLSAVLARHSGNITRAAEELVMQRSHLSRQLKKLGLRP